MSNANLKLKNVGVDAHIDPHHKGITLIALIITIIVMMILVAVSVTVALDGGLFGIAKKAASETELKAEEEMLLSAVIGAVGREGKVEFENLKLPDGFIKITDEICKSPSGNIFTVTENGEIIYGTNGVIEVPSEELAEELRTAIDEGKVDKVVKEIKDGKEYKAVIPTGFEVSTKSGENTISGGLVISDKDGNEFVWVPCTTDKNDISELTLYAKDTKYNDGTKAVFQREYKEYNDWKDEGGNAESISKYGGFYVGRYEAGIPSNAPFYANTDGASYIIDGRNTTEYIPVSKPNQPTWNYISQVNSKVVSQAMYSDSISVESNLIDSYAWDTIVNWMERNNPGIATYSIKYGNYLDSNILLNNKLYATYLYDYSSWSVTRFPTKYQKGTIEIPARTGNGKQTIYELATGATDSTKVLNIYDMAGNMWEWTTEVGYHGAGNEATEYTVRRGGGIDIGANGFPISYRYGKDTSATRFLVYGFRVVLYIK